MLFIILIVIYYFNIKEIIVLVLEKEYNSLIAIVVLTFISFYLSIGQLLAWPLPDISGFLHQIFKDLL